MALLKEVMAAVGIGGATVTLTLNRTRCPRGSEVTGTLTLTGGEVEQRIETITLLLKETWRQGKTQLSNTLYEFALTGSFVAGVQETFQFPFIFSIPDNARLSKGVYDNTNLHADVDILSAVNPRTSIEIKVGIHPEIAAVQHAMRLLGFTQGSGLPEFSIPEDPDIVSEYYRAPEALWEQLDGASLHLHIRGNDVSGWLSLNRQEQNIGDRLKALVGADRERFNLRIPRAELWHENRPHANGAIPYLRWVLQSAVALPDDASRWLVRPSSAPNAGGDVLLRPASAQPASRKHLLRPLDEPCPEEEKPM